MGYNLKDRESVTLLLSFNKHIYIGDGGERNIPHYDRDEKEQLSSLKNAVGTYRKKTKIRHVNLVYYVQNIHYTI